eukprot:7444347-Alexandrium_andersonii.AAC.1
MQSPAVPTTATATVAMTPAAMMAWRRSCEGPRGRRRDSGALDVEPAIEPLGAHAVGAELHVQAD